ncbi:hypothetical protein PLESTM_000253900 [Pleodorina starrii]|nr:hypothetical protein PLESTM_000253900 [Pleodorina starrii]
MHPIAAELLHNGAAFQVLGITNYSHWGDANAFRGCLLRYEHLREQMVDVAKARVQRFTHVGTTDRLFESAASALVSMGLSVESPAYSGGDEDVAGRGGTRRKEGQGPGQGQGQGRGGGGGGGRTVSSEAAAQLQLLAKLIREARRRLQTAQKELVDAQRTQADPSLVSMLQSRVDTARNDLIEAQEKLAVVRDLLPANLGGGGAAQDIHLEENVGHAARRRLLEEVSSSSDQQGEDGTRQQQQLQGSETSAGAAGSAQVEATEEGAAGGLGDLEEMAEQRRRLASTVTLPTVDAFGNPLDPEYKRITRSNVGAEFMRCANRAQERSTSRRDQSLAAMATADGRHVSFSKAARTRIPQEVLDLIRSYNTMDTPLHQTGLAILDRRVSEQRAAGLYQDIPTELRARTDRGEERQRQRQQGARAQAKEDELR